MFAQDPITIKDGPADPCCEHPEICDRHNPKGFREVEASFLPRGRLDCKDNFFFPFCYGGCSCGG